jgi:hypothetical protein
MQCKSVVTPIRVVWLWAAVLLIAGCTHKTAAPDLTCCDSYAPDEAYLVAGNRQWVDTKIKFKTGDAITVIAQGSVRFNNADGAQKAFPSQAGPNGTFLFSDDVAGKPFPLPSAAGGPASCYCLIGRIGDGPAFYIGERNSWIADRSGTLKLGINDFDVTDNSGEFYATVSQPESVQPVSFEQTLSAADSVVEPPHISETSVMVFYIDGLRPDVVREMTTMGHLPNINTLFIEGGTWLSNTFTAFPSDTITSNGTMWTGCFSDRHGLKGQVRFSRRTLHSQSYLEPLGPNRSSRLLSPQGIDRFIHNSQAASIGMIQGRESSKRWSQRNITDVAPLYQHLRSNGGDWATGVLPMMTEVPPLLWTRSLIREMPYLQSHDTWRYIDDANTHYALQELVGRNAPVTIIWLPETDSISHKYNRGQFGATRRTIAKADFMIGKIVDALRSLGRLQNTYLMLVSDHGHHGGRNAHLAHFDLADELIHKPRQMTADGDWVGGGWGLSVRQHRFWNRHPNDASREFVFVDGDSDGVARIFLPRGNFRSGNWTGAFRPADLLSYRIADHLPPLNLVDAFCSAQATHEDGSQEHPVDLVLMKLTDTSVLISTADRGHAVIERKKDDLGKWIYRYTPVTNLQPEADGHVSYQPVENPKQDPLGLLNSLPARLLEQYHDEKAWLQATLRTDYPDSVVTLSRHMLWDENLRYREVEFAPDLVVTAKRNWYFGIKSSPGTMHGYPFQESMRATLFVSGPGIRRGTRVEEPCRLVDLTPTILEMANASFNADELDGSALRSIYQSNDETVAADPQPVYWKDVDLDAWKPLEYRPMKEYDHLPLTVNRPTKPLDLNNIVYNVLGIGEISVLKLLDDLLLPASDPKWGLLNVVEGTDQRVRRNRREWVSEGAQSLNVTGTSLGDYSISSLGNMKRVDGVIDWVQHRGLSLDRKIAGNFGRETLPGSPHIHAGIDGVQGGFWEVYRFTQRLVVQVLDETIINGIENSADRTMNSFREQPSEIIVQERPINFRRDDQTASQPQPRQ